MSAKLKTFGAVCAAFCLVAAVPAQAEEWDDAKAQKEVDWVQKVLQLNQILSQKAFAAEAGGDYKTGCGYFQTVGASLKSNQQYLDALVANRTTPVGGTDIKALGQKWTLLVDQTKKNVARACKAAGITPDA